MKVQVFGQFELEEHIGNNGNTFSHLISIGNPGILKFLKSPDYIMPPQFRKHFERILRLEFYDVETLGQLQNPKYKNKRMPRKSDIKKIIKFYERTKNNTNGYTVHCWRGIARSTATAFGLLYLIHGDELKAYNSLKKIRPEARPHRQMVKWFDEILGSNLSDSNSSVIKARIEAMKREFYSRKYAKLEELDE